MGSRKDRGRGWGWWGGGRSQELPWQLTDGSPDLEVGPCRCTHPCFLGLGRIQEWLISIDTDFIAFA